MGAEPARVGRRELEPVEARCVERLVPLPFERHEQAAVEPAGAHRLRVQQDAGRAFADRLDDADLRLDARPSEGVPHRVAVVEREHADRARRALDRLE